MFIYCRKYPPCIAKIDFASIFNQTSLGQMQTAGIRKLELRKSAGIREFGLRGSVGIRKFGHGKQQI